jgi:hypothetical protein
MPCQGHPSTSSSRSAPRTSHEPPSTKHASKHQALKVFSQSLNEPGVGRAVAENSVHRAVIQRHVPFVAIPPAFARI